MNTRMDRAKLHIGAYCLAGYAHTEQHIKDIAACGIDLMLSLRAERPVLDLFHRHGVGVVLSGAVPGWFGGKGENAGTMAAANPLEAYGEAARHFADHPAVWGIDAGDEPSALDLPHYGKVLQRVEALFPRQFAYLNLYPAYAMLASNTPAEVRAQLGTDTYEEYIARYCECVDNDYLSLDHYVYSADKESLHATLATAANACRRTGRSLWSVLQVNSLDPGHWITANELRYQAYTALAYGSEVISWACWTAGWWHNQVLDSKGEKTEQYEKLQTVNRELLALGDAYMQFKNIAAHRVGSEPLALRGCTVQCESGLALGEMTARDGSGRTALLLAVQNENADCPVALFTGGKAVTLWYAGQSTRLQPAEDGACRFTLQNGCGALVIPE